MGLIENSILGNWGKKLNADKRANVGLAVIIGILIVLIIPPIIISVFEPARILFQLFSIFLVYSTIRMYLGPGALTIIISAFFIYFLVFKYTLIFASLWVFQFLLMLNFTGVIIWGLGKLFGPH